MMMTNRRSFLSSLAKLTIIVPVAVDRMIWKPSPPKIFVPARPTGWTETDIEMYNRLPIELAKISLEGPRSWARRENIWRDGKMFLQNQNIGQMIELRLFNGPNHKYETDA